MLLRRRAKSEIDERVDFGCMNARDIHRRYQDRIFLLYVGYSKTHSRPHALQSAINSGQFSQLARSHPVRELRDAGSKQCKHRRHMDFSAPARNTGHESILHIPGEIIHNNYSRFCGYVENDLSFEISVFHRSTIIQSRSTNNHQ